MDLRFLPLAFRHLRGPAGDRPPPGARGLCGQERERQDHPHALFPVHLLRLAPQGGEQQSLRPHRWRPSPGHFNFPHRIGRGRGLVYHRNAGAPGLLAGNPFGAHPGRPDGTHRPGDLREDLLSGAGGPPGAQGPSGAPDRKPPLRRRGGPRRGGPAGFAEGTGPIPQVPLCPGAQPGGQGDGERPAGGAEGRRAEPSRAGGGLVPLLERGGRPGVPGGKTPARRGGVGTPGPEDGPPGDAGKGSGGLGGVRSGPEGACDLPRPRGLPRAGRGAHGGPGGRRGGAGCGNPGGRGPAEGPGGAPVAGG